MKIWQGLETEDKFVIVNWVYLIDGSIDILISHPANLHLASVQKMKKV